MDGRRQRNALTAAEQAVAALAGGDASRAVANADKAAGLDQIGAFADLPGVVRAIAERLEPGASPGAPDWEDVRSALPPGPLHAMVDSHLA